MDKRKAAAAAAAAVAAAGMVTGASFDTPADLLADSAPVIETVQDDGGDAASVDEERQRSPAARVRTWVMGLPAAVRALVGVPLWCVGRVLLSALSLLWIGAAPALSRLLGWLCLAVLAAAVFTASVKAAFPALPLRRLWRPRRLLALLGLTALLAAADLALPGLWPEEGGIPHLVWRCGAVCLLVFACGWTLHSEGKREAERRQEEVSVEERARRLADTVCPPRA